MPKTAVVVLLVLAIACSPHPTRSTTYQVAYSLRATSDIVFDSLRYEDEQGTLVKVVSPDTTWRASFYVPSGGYVQGLAWVRALSSAETATLKVSWTISGYSTAADSSTGTSTAAGAFTLHVVRRRIPS